MLKNNTQALKKFNHFICDKPNDINFVVSVWNSFIQKVMREYKPKSIVVWSDGGRKHFKMSRNLMFWWCLAKKWKVSVEYNFYECYHGHSACDAAAAHVKTALTNFQKNENTVVTEIGKVAELVNSVTNHECTVCNVDDRAAAYLPGITYPQIMSCHHFTFDTSNSTMSGYEDSTATNLITTYTVPMQLIQRSNKIKHRKVRKK